MVFTSYALNLRTLCSQDRPDATNRDHELCAPMLSGHKFRNSQSIETNGVLSVACTEYSYALILSIPIHATCSVYNGASTNSPSLWMGPTSPGFSLCLPSTLLLPIAPSHPCDSETGSPTHTFFLFFFFLPLSHLCLPGCSASSRLPDLRRTSTASHHLPSPA